jgi:hypothetical protein
MDRGANRFEKVRKREREKRIKLRIKVDERNRWLMLSKARETLIIVSGPLTLIAIVTLNAGY